MPSRIGSAGGLCRTGTRLGCALGLVHGFAGSAQQYESQAMRFVANGYSPDRIVTYDHDGAGMEGDPARAAKVAKYVAIDGMACVDVVPCIAPNQAALPGQSHVETATSPESFAMQYEFLVGKPPATTNLEPQREPVVLEGRR